ncbi:NADP-dependent oxidoreductase [Actinokineospora sp. HUAS TT18]|uniref:NADP-dependent oxidoreductase n=1 Tax=Actinokineospora sp. HUAS TT18 TaxID=3447451 RepID=UPI003F51E095
MTALEVHLARRPVGVPSLDDFAFVEITPPALGPGEVRVRNHVMSVDPYMRGRMNDVKSYAPPFPLGAPMEGGAVGDIVESTVDSLPVGTFVLHNAGWRSEVVLPGAAVVEVDPSLPLGAYLGVLGMPGLTAYAGLLDVAEFQPGDTVFVSAAAGAVGAVVGQIARLRGAKRVIGSAGSAEKVRYLLDELGFDAAFNYKDDRVVKQLAAAAPEGIEVYFDNVGGEHLEAALSVLNVHGRIAVCGMISQYNATEPNPAPRNLIQIVSKRLTVRGLLVRDHADRRADFLREVGAWVRSGELRYTETVVDGLRNAPSAFLSLLEGGNTGKMLVRLI